MLEFQLGKIVVLPVYPEAPPLQRVGRTTSRSTGSNHDTEEIGLNPPLIIALNATDDVEWAEMLIKVRSSQSLSSQFSRLNPALAH